LNNSVTHKPYKSAYATLKRGYTTLKARISESINVYRLHDLFVDYTTILYDLDITHKTILRSGAQRRRGFSPAAAARHQGRPNEGGFSFWGIKFREEKSDKLPDLKKSDKPPDSVKKLDKLPDFDSKNLIKSRSPKSKHRKGGAMCDS